MGEAIDNNITPETNSLHGERMIKSGSLAGKEIYIQGLWKEMTGKSWIDSSGNIACVIYVLRVIEENLPVDDNVYYGKIEGLGHLIHESEL